MEKQKIKETLNEAREERKKRIASIKLDIYFFDRWLEKNDEDTLRDALAEENEKLEKDGNGKVIKDQRDLENLAELNAKIDKLQKMKNQRLQYIDLLNDLKFYLEVIDELDKSKEIEVFN